LEIDHPDNFFRIEWQSKSRYARWQFDQIFSEETLAWLCSETGQTIFNLIQAEIESAIEDGKSSVVLQSRASGVASLIEIRGETHPGAPQLEQMEYLIKALDFQCNVSDGESGRSRIEISW
jgi:isopentenyl diphosphate isomerase/L-lactate dehydrogenase-like FMN-dependent dehydrogenase